MGRLIKRLGHINVHPYYVYIHDLVKGGEDMRTTVQTAIEIEKFVRGTMAGFNTPTFVVDAQAVAENAVSTVMRRMTVSLESQSTRRHRLNRANILCISIQLTS